MRVLYIEGNEGVEERSKSLRFKFVWTWEVVRVTSLPPQHTVLSLWPLQAVQHDPSSS
jgi:hypothetical protein